MKPGLDLVGGVKRGLKNLGMAMLYLALPIMLAAQVYDANGRQLVNALVTDGAGALNVIVDSSALPSGASTSAKQDTIIGHVDGLEGFVDGIEALLTTLAGGVSGSEYQVDVITLPALPAGDNNIGDVDVATIAAGNNNIGDVDVASIAAGNNNIWDVDVASSALPTGASTLAEQQSQTTHLATIAGDTTDIEAATELIDDTIFADDAAFTAGTSKVQTVGGQAVAHGAAPDTADAGDAVVALFNRLRMQFVIGGAPNAVTETATVLDADGAQTGAAIHTVSTGTKICVTRLVLTCSADNTVAVEFRVAFDTDGTFAAKSTTGTVGTLVDHGNIAPGGGLVVGNGGGILGCGADDEDLRYSTDDPVGDECSVSATYYEIAS